MRAPGPEAPPDAQKAARTPLQERLAALEAQHSGQFPHQPTAPPDPEAAPPTDAEALANLRAGFAGHIAHEETVPPNG